MFTPEIRISNKIKKRILRACAKNLKIKNKFNLYIDEIVWNDKIYNLNNKSDIYILDGTCQRGSIYMYALRIEVDLYIKWNSLKIKI